MTADRSSFKMPANLKTPCDGCGKRYPKRKLTVRGIYAYCHKCDPDAPSEDHHAARAERECR